MLWRKIKYVRGWSVSEEARVAILNKMVEKPVKKVTFKQEKCERGEGVSNVGISGEGYPGSRNSVYKGPVAHVLEPKGEGERSRG